MLAEARVIPDSGLDEFVRALADILGDPGLRPDTPLSAIDDVGRFLLWLAMAEAGAELPPGIEDSLRTPSELHEHAHRRWSAERRGGPR